MLLPFLCLLAGSIAAPIEVSIDTTGFSKPSTFYSSDGNALCVSGNVPVNVATDKNVQINIPDNITQAEATNILLELLSADSNATSMYTGAQQNVSGTFDINAQLCYPLSGHNTTTVQFLTHGIGFDKSYWDLGPNNSYIGSAASKGRVTFAYDRLGVGNSSHPDPLQVVQAPLEVAIAQELATMLRHGAFANKNFNHVIGVGHSFGSSITTTVASNSPSTFDAVVITGFSTNRTGLPQFTSALNLIPAFLSSTGRFPGLAAGYLLPSTLYGVQYAFFHMPDFTEEILSTSFATIQTVTFGEQFSMPLIGYPAPKFTGPAMITNGDHDLIFCDGDCSYPDNILASALSDLFPNADSSKSRTYQLLGSGHGLNAAANANVAFTEIQNFVSSLGFN